MDNGDTHSGFDYNAIVIGSGFGGAVASCRLAQAGLRVLILERGKKYKKGTFPRHLKNQDGWFWNRDQGLFDIKPLNEMSIVQGAGLGGGSLIYANVHLRPVDKVFESGWPKVYNRALLDPYYDLVGYMLDIKPIPTNDPTKIPNKTALMEKVASDLGRKDQFFHPNLAVNFGEPHKTTINKFGKEQSGCIYCGECDIGCNENAKNTLDLNYLAVASQNGAEV
jgi:cholesterol oxidase